MYPNTASTALILAFGSDVKGNVALFDISGRIHVNANEENSVKKMIITK